MIKNTTKTKIIIKIQQKKKNNKNTTKTKIITIINTTKTEISIRGEMFKDNFSIIVNVKATSTSSLLALAFELQVNEY